MAFPHKIKIQYKKLLLIWLKNALGFGSRGLVYFRGHFGNSLPLFRHTCCMDAPSWFYFLHFSIGTLSIVPGGSGLTRKNVLIKNPQFLPLPNHYETLSKWDPHKYLILTKFRNYLVKIVDFLIKAYFRVSPDSPGTHCMLCH